MQDELQQRIVSAIAAFDAERAALGTNDTWNISAEVGQFLHDQIVQHGYTSGIEIGTSTGYSALWLALAFSKTGGHLQTIESHAERHATAKERFDMLDLSSVITLHKGHAPEIFSEINMACDFAFFDATKKQHVEFFAGIKDHLSQGGLIIADNVLSHYDVMSKYVDHVNADPHFDSTVLELGTGLCLSQKH